jgi:hypothetical protein
VAVDLFKPETTDANSFPIFQMAILILSALINAALAITSGTYTLSSGSLVVPPLYSCLLETCGKVLEINEFFAGDKRLISVASAVNTKIGNCYCDYQQKVFIGDRNANELTGSFGLNVVAVNDEISFGIANGIDLQKFSFRNSTKTKQITELYLTVPEESVHFSTDINPNLGFIHLAGTDLEFKCNSNSEGKSACLVKYPAYKKCNNSGVYAPKDFLGEASCQLKYENGECSSVPLSPGQLQLNPEKWETRMTAQTGKFFNSAFIFGERYRCLNVDGLCSCEKFVYSEPLACNNNNNFPPLTTIVRYSAGWQGLRQYVDRYSKLIYDIPNRTCEMQPIQSLSSPPTLPEKSFKISDIQSDGLYVPEYNVTLSCEIEFCFQTRGYGISRFLSSELPALCYNSITSNQQKVYVGDKACVVAH